MTGIDTERLAELLALTETDLWRARPAEQARFITEMIGRAGETVSTELVVTVAADIAIWAAHCGASTAEEAARRFQDVVDVAAVADCLGERAALPDSVTVEARSSGAAVGEKPVPEPLEAPEPEPAPEVLAAPELDVAVPPLPAGEDAALEAAAQVLFAGFSPSPDWAGVTESLRRRYRSQAGEIVAAYLAARPSPDI